MKLVPGQTLWYVPRDKRGTPRYVVVVKVGRKWATLHGGWGRVDMDTLAVDGGEFWSPGSCYLSEAAYLESEALLARWKQFIDVVDVQRYGSPPDGVTIADIDAAQTLLRL